jgi:hypothetical protein
MEFVIALVVLLLAAWFVSAPLRRREPELTTEDPRLADLEARKQAVYRQIRDAELDHAQGKLSEADWRRVDAELRREAIEILRAIDAGGVANPPPSPRGG